MSATAPAATLLALIGGSWKTQAIRAAAELRLADVLADGPLDVATLAGRLDADADALARLLVGLRSLGLVEADASGRVATTELGALLRTGTDTSLRAWALWWGGYPWHAWGRLADTVRSGRPARAAVPGHAGYGFLAADPAAAAVFHDARVALTRLAAREVLRVHDFAGHRHIVDVGGGPGELLHAVLRAHPAARGTLLELPEVLPGAALALARAGLADRCEVLAGDFFDAVPAGAERYLLKSVLHNWDDTHCVRLLERCRDAMAPRARLVIVERLMPARIEDRVAVHAVVQSDLAMLVGPGGRERTSDAMDTLLAAAGLRRVGATPIATGHTVIEAVAAGRGFSPPRRTAPAPSPRAPRARGRGCRARAGARRCRTGSRSRAPSGRR